MRTLSPIRKQRARTLPATSPYQWLEAVSLSKDELAQLREHVERSLQLADGEVFAR